MSLPFKKRHPLTAQMVDLAQRQGLSLQALATLSGVGITSLSCWGIRTAPGLERFERVLNSIGYQLVIRERKP